MSAPFFPRGNADWKTNHEHIATTHWSRDEDVINNFALREDAKNPFIFGKLKDHQGKDVLQAYDDDAGIVIVAGSRSGKGVSLISVNLLSGHGAPAIVLDMKGENAELTAEWRHKNLGLRSVIFDPYDITRFDSSSFNPLLVFDPSDKQYIDDLADFADSFQIKGDSKDVHWDESSRAGISMVLNYVIRNHPPSRRNLYWVRKLILKGQSKAQSPNYKPPVFEYDQNLSPTENAEIKQEIEWQIEDDREPSFLQFLKNLAEHEDDIIAGTAQRFLQAGDRERGAIVSTMMRNTEFLDSPSIEEILCNNDFDLADLRRSTVYLVLPEKRLDRQSRWLRMMFTMFLGQLQDDWKDHRGDPSLLLIIDEAAALGHSSVIERASGYIAGFGVKMFTIWQDLGQLRAIYDKRWETFIGNAGLFVAFGNVDMTTQDYISRRCGKCETARTDVSYSGGTSESENTVGMGQAMSQPLSLADSGGSKGESRNYSVKPSYVLSPLLLPEEVGRYFGKATGKILALFGQGQPVCADRVIYYQDMPFKKRAGKNSMYE